MKKIVLNDEESKNLKEDGFVQITRNGFEICISVDNSYECGYSIDVVNPFDKVIVK